MKRRCITRSRGLTVGKVYEIHNESFIDDDGDERHTGKGDYRFSTIPDTPAKFKLLKPITGRALSNYGACRGELVKFVVKYGLDDCATAGFASVDEYVFQVERDNLGWLLRQGYLERVKEPERTYSIEQRIKTRGDEYIIAGDGSGGASLILVSLDSGCTKSGRHSVKFISKITQAEMDRMVDPEDFQGIVE